MTKFELLMDYSLKMLIIVFCFAASAMFLSVAYSVVVLAGRL